MKPLWLNKVWHMYLVESHEEKFSDWLSQINFF